VSRYLKRYSCRAKIRLAKADTAAFYDLAARFADMYDLRTIPSWQKQLNALGLKGDISRWLSHGLAILSGQVYE
jgi:hypothetical protein